MISLCLLPMLGLRNPPALFVVVDVAVDVASADKAETPPKLRLTVAKDDVNNKHDRISDADTTMVNLVLEGCNKIINPCVGQRL